MMRQGLAEYFAVLRDAEVQQLLRVSAAVWKLGEAEKSPLDLFQHVGRTCRRVIPVQVIEHLGQVPSGIFGQLDIGRLSAGRATLPMLGHDIGGGSHLAGIDLPVSECQHLQQRNGLLLGLSPAAARASRRLNCRASARASARLFVAPRERAPGS